MQEHFNFVWNENMVVLADFLEMDKNEREGKFPFIWVVDQKQQLSRVMVAEKIVESCEERRDFWIMLKDIAGVKPEEVKEENLEQKIRAEVVGKIAQGLMKMASDNGNGFVDLGIDLAPATNGTAAAASAEPISASNYSAPWIETEECTSCDECTKINSKIFEYNSAKKAFIKDPLGGKYSDIVKAAEKCTAQVIHPGLPADMSEKDIESWIKRAEKYN